MTSFTYEPLGNLLTQTAPATGTVRWSATSYVLLTVMPRESVLVLYDYGQGGRWAIVLAGAASEITERFPELTIESQRPGWMSDEYFARLEAGLIDIDKPRGLLADILKGRRS